MARKLILVTVVLTLLLLGCGQAPPPLPTETMAVSPTATAATPWPPAASRPSLGDSRTRPADGMVMVYVPAGEFQMGSDDAEVDLALEMCNQYYGDCETTTPSSTSLDLSPATPLATGNRRPARTSTWGFAVSPL